MIAKTVLFEMIVKYIDENGIKSLMELVLEAINNSSGRV